MKVKKLLSGLLIFSSLFILSILAYAEVTTKVLSVVDGDTLKIEFGGKKEYIRLIGIDAPECSINPKAKKDAERAGEDIHKILSMGKKATAFVKTLVKGGDTVKIEFDVQQRDRYGRLLGYVYIGDGRMLNEEIVKAGYASLLSYPPNIKYEKRFLKIYRKARESHQGLWK